MSIPLVYPASLPTPTVADYQPDERRVLSTGRPFESRAIQLDEVAVRQIMLPALTEAQATTLKTWGEGDLDFWANWFAATWPLPQGRVQAVYAWLGPPRFDNVPGGYWRVSGAVELRGVGMPPVLLQAPMFLLHFENNLDDVSGHLFEADDVTSDGGANSFTFTGDDPAFGSFAGRFPGTNNHIRSEPWPAGLHLAAFDWQIEGFIRIRDTSGGVGGPIIRTGSLQSGGNVVGPAAEAGQFSLAVSNVGVFAGKYSTALGSADLVTVGSPAAVTQDDWWHWALVNDSTSLRLYAGEKSGGVSQLIAQALGKRPFAGAYDALQRFFIGCTYDGGIPPLEVYIGRFHGDMDEMRMLDFVLYTGSAIDIPRSAFRDAGA